jgi:hypothetical protein
MSKFSAHQKLLLIGLPIVGALALFVRGAPDIEMRPIPILAAAPDQRAAVVAAAVSQLGNTDPTAYWQNVLATHPAGGIHADWCGAFALWCLHQAGLALDWNWEIGSGFLLSNVHRSLPTTTDPKPGDVAYFDHNEHEAIVELVTPSGVQIINGNGENGAVSRSTALRSSVTAFFSIAPLLSVGAA